MFLLLVGLLGLPLRVSATCVVESPSLSVEIAGSLPALLERVRRGECYTEAAALATMYKPYLQMARGFHVIEWRQSMDLQLRTPLAALQGHGGNPLILRAVPGTQVRLIGQQLTSNASITIAGGAAPVILDGLTISGFAREAVTIESDHAALLRTRVLASGATGTGGDPATSAPGVLVRGRQVRIVESEIANHRGPGVVITEDVSQTECTAVTLRRGERTQIRASEIHHNDGAGVVVDSFDVRLVQNRVHHNAMEGVVVASESVAVRCARARGEPVSPVMWHTAFITETGFWQNGGDAHPGIAVRGEAFPPPVDLITVSPETATEIVVVGNLSRVADPLAVWNDGVLNFEALHVELFLSDGSPTGEGQHFVTRIDSIDPTTRQFVAHIPQSHLRIEGQDVNDPTFIATAVDDEHLVTSPFSLPLAMAQRRDWDGDGLPNSEEDRNHDGVVDVTETDPRLADSDGDGLTDGAEVLQLGHVASATQAETSALRVVLARPQDLDPRNPDSDGDCLPDGLEMRVDQPSLPPWQLAPGSVLQRRRVDFSAACLKQLRTRNVLLIDNATPWDPLLAKSPDNVTAPYDTDPTTWTDPTSADTDSDGVSDGMEDWNIDGMRTAQSSADAVTTLVASAPAWRETDPQERDSDDDGLADGAEGDLDGDGMLGEGETDPLRRDTDGDGLYDAEESVQFGTKPNACDSDQDGLGDGLEAGRVNPYPAQESCHGLQAAGSNFESFEALDPLKLDSDDDGIPDGVEDGNHNGWLDRDESDPTVADSDHDGMNDALERMGDFDFDGTSDIALAEIDHGAKCAPPLTVADLDCDGLPNARDDDSDNDGCSDKSEAGDTATDAHGIPAAFTAAVKGCLTAGGGGASSSPPAPGPAPGENVDPDTELRDHYSRQITGGGSCSLMSASANHE